jgi:hypothetical protein
MRWMKHYPGAPYILAGSWRSLKQMTWLQLSGSIAEDGFSEEGGQYLTNLIKI